MHPVPEQDINEITDNSLLDLPIIPMLLLSIMLGHQQAMNNEGKCNKQGVKTDPSNKMVS